MKQKILLLSIAVTLLAITTSVMAQTYGLWVRGEQVTATNKDNLPCQSGTITYNPESFTLTLDNAVIDNTAGSFGRGIQSNINGLIIELKGTNTIENSSYQGIDLYSNTTIQGTGTLSIKKNTHASIALQLPNMTLTITGGCTINTDFGIRGGDYSQHLNIINSTVNVAKHGIYNLASLTLTGCKIATPAGAAFSETLHGVALDDALVETAISIIPDGSTGISASLAEQGIELVAGKNSVEVVLPHQASVPVYTLAGVEVFGKTLSAGNHQIPLANGFYVVKVNNGAEKVVVR